MRETLIASIPSASARRAWRISPARQDQQPPLRRGQRPVAGVFLEPVAKAARDVVQGQGKALGGMFHQPAYNKPAYASAPAMPAR